MIRMPVGFYGLAQTSDLMRTWNAWYSVSMQAARLAWDAKAVVALRFMQIARENARGRQSETRNVPGSAAIRRGRFRLNHPHRDLVRSIAVYPASPPIP